MAAAPSIVWFRQDLRLDDNPALLAAVRREAPIVPVFIWSPEEEGDWPSGAASRWWLHQSLEQLADRLKKTGLHLILRKGSSLGVLRELIRKTSASAVFWNRRYEPAAVERDRIVEESLRKDGLEIRTFSASLLFEPAAVLKNDGTPYRVFTPFWKSCLAREEPGEPVPAPTRLPAFSSPLESVLLAALELEPKIDWAVGLRETWMPGEEGAPVALDRFLDEIVFLYDALRDRPDALGTSRLSPYLHFGEISPRRVWHAVRRRAAERNSKLSKGPEEFLRQLVWRDFSYSMIFHFPQTAARPLRAEFERFPWVGDSKGLRAWQRGRTGYPLVDAGMRELWHTGWMHNRVRMVVASFLVKHLRIHWLEGARWFWDTLVDADLANNTMGWQWTAGCGADAAPYFRVFNPTSQAAKFDPEGEYIHRWVPELERLPVSQVYQPWAAPESVLKQAGIRLGETYPLPYVDHAVAREKALDAYATIRKAGR